MEPLEPFQQIGGEDDTEVSVKPNEIRNNENDLEKSGKGDVDVEDLDQKLKILADSQRNFSHLQLLYNQVKTTLSKNFHLESNEIVKMHQDIDTLQSFYSLLKVGQNEMKIDIRLNFQTPFEFSSLS